MQMSRIVEYVFFFGLLGLSGYMVWQLVAPFVTALALAAIIVTIFYPLHNLLGKYLPWKNKTLTALLTTSAVFLVIVLPVVFISLLIGRELVSFLSNLDASGTNVELLLFDSIAQLEVFVQQFNPEYSFKAQITAITSWLTGNIGTIFASTVSTILMFFIALIGSFYFFRDGKELLQLLVKASPLPDREDEIIFHRLASSIRAVVSGTILLALIQGILAAVGFTLFGIDRALLWGSLASLGALMPGLGTSIVTLPAVAYLFMFGEVTSAIGLLIWSLTVVGLVDNLLGPYLMSRGNNMHPFIILIAVLGGIYLMGPVGFIIGPVIVTLFLVLLEIYNQYIVHEQSLKLPSRSKKT